jgi:hypothetical protein
MERVPLFTSEVLQVAPLSRNSMVQENVSSKGKLFYMGLVGWLVGWLVS